MYRLVHPSLVVIADMHAQSICLSFYVEVGVSIKQSISRENGQREKQRGILRNKNSYSSSMR